MLSVRNTRQSTQTRIEQSIPPENIIHTARVEGKEAMVDTLRRMLCSSSERSVSAAMRRCDNEQFESK